MSFYTADELHDLYIESKDEAGVWREHYNDYERLADNGLLEGLDENLPQVNDGSLAASLFKLPKRIVSTKLRGRAKALDADDAWITELANIEWENHIIPNANSQAQFHRKWKDAVRKAAIYGGVPLITLFVENGKYTGADFIVGEAQDVILQAGKKSDLDSEVIFWEVFLSKKQLRDLIERAKSESTEEDAYSKWDVAALNEILDHDLQEDRDGDVEHNERNDKAVRKGGFHFYIAYQRGVEAPFYMCHAEKGKPSKKGSTRVVREWSNPDPTGDVPIHYLYCYQDFINPYGIGIVKLAGGTQNVLDIMRKYDVLATQLGIRPPIRVKGTTSGGGFDEGSIVNAENAIWFTGQADVDFVEISNGVYQQLPDRIAMYKTSLNQVVPTGDTSIGSAAGDPQYSKTPAGVKFQASSLSIDDEDFKDNLYMTYEAKAKSMINIHFANMQGDDLRKLSDDERDMLARSGLEFPLDEQGTPTNELDIIWDEARAAFDFEVDAESDKTRDEEQRLEGLTRVADFVKDPATRQLIATGQPIILGHKKLDPGELISEIVSLSTQNDKIITDVTPEDEAGMEAQAAEEQAQQEAMQMQQPQEEMPMDMPTGEVSPEQAAINVEAVMREYNVDEYTAAAMLEAERQGYDPEEITEALTRRTEPTYA